MDEILFPPTLNITALRQAVEAKKQDSGETWCAIAKKLEISEQVFHRKGQLSVESLIKILYWLEADLNDFLILEKSSYSTSCIPSELTILINKDEALSAEEKQFLCEQCIRTREIFINLRNREKNNGSTTTFN